MSLPSLLQHAIESELDHYGFKEIQNGYENLSKRYRASSNNPSPLISEQVERMAYVAARMPATFASITAVLQHVESPESLLDFGAGPGTALWAVLEAFPSLQKALLVERDAHLIALGKKLAAQRSHFPAEWLQQPMEQYQQNALYDLVTLSYSIGELPSSAIPAMIKTAWEATGKYLVIIEPGTPEGFERIRAIRTQLIALGAHIVAPCPHRAECPMSQGDWCHFSKRIERTSLHRKLKQGSLGYEDEKFSYLIFSKLQAPLTQARILRHPQKHTGHISLELCTVEGLQKRIISKRTPEEYKRARKAEWGDSF